MLIDRGVCQREWVVDVLTFLKTYALLPGTLVDRMALPSLVHKTRGGRAILCLPVSSIDAAGGVPFSLSAILSLLLSPCFTSVPSFFISSCVVSTQETMKLTTHCSLEGH